MSKAIHDMAKKYYEDGKWNRAQIDHLYELGRLTEEEYRDIVGDKE